MDGVFGFAAPGTPQDHFTLIQAYGKVIAVVGMLHYVEVRQPGGTVRTVMASINDITTDEISATPTTEEDAISLGLHDCCTSGACTLGAFQPYEFSSLVERQQVAFYALFVSIARSVADLPLVAARRAATTATTSTTTTAATTRTTAARRRGSYRGWQYFNDKRRATAP